MPGSGKDGSEPMKQLCASDLSYERAAKLNPHPKNISVPEVGKVSPGKDSASETTPGAHQFPAPPLPSESLLSQKKQIHSPLYLVVVRHLGTAPRRPGQISREI